MKYLRHAYTKNVFVVYVKFKVNWASVFDQATTARTTCLTHTWSVSSGHLHVTCWNYHINKTSPKLLSLKHWELSYYLRGDEQCLKIKCGGKKHGLHRYINSQCKMIYPWPPKSSHLDYWINFSLFLPTFHFLPIPLLYTKLSNGLVQRLLS